MKLLTNTTLLLLFSLFSTSLFSPRILRAKFILGRLKHVLLGLLLLLSLVFEAQESFRIDFSIDELSKIYSSGFIENSEGEYIGIYKNYVSSDTASLRDAHLIKITPNGDTSTYRFYKGNDTTLFFNNIFQVSEDPIEYFVFGFYELADNDERLLHEYMLWLDADFNSIREKKYQLSTTYMPGYSISDVIQLADGSFLEARSPSGPGYTYLFHFSALGDSLNFKAYEAALGCQVYDLTYSPDSTSFWLHCNPVKSNPDNANIGVIQIDENLDQTKVMYYQRWLSDFFSAKVLPNNKLVATGRYNELLWPELEYKYHLATYIVDTGLNIMHEDYLTHPDTITFTMPRCLDYYYPDQIFTGATHNHIYLYSSEPSWFVIAKYDSSLNLLYERYIGGDANYVLRNVCATSDSGVLLSGDYFDHTDEIERRKGVVIKLNPDGLLVGSNEYQDDIQVSRALVYPNPGIEKLMVRTALKNCTFKLYNTSGAKVLSQSLDNLITQIATSDLKTGTYVYVIEQNNRIVESGKWIKQ